MLMKLLVVALIISFIYSEVKTFKKMEPIYDKYGNDVEYYKISPHVRRACLATSLAFGAFLILIAAAMLTNGFGQTNSVEELERRIAEAEKACGVTP